MNAVRILRGLFIASRPISWLNTAFPFAAGYMVASGGRIDALFVVGTIYFLIPYNLALYGINDVFDYESDKANPRKGGIEGGAASRALHSPIIIASFAINLPLLVVMMLIPPSTLGSSLVLLAVTFFMLAYSLKGLRFKEIPLLDSLTSSLHFVGPLIYALSLTDLSGMAWAYIAAFLCWGMASHAFGAVQDIAADRAGGISSIATYVGARNTVRLSALLYLAACLIMVLSGSLGAVVGIIGLIYVINIKNYFSIDDAAAPSTNRAWRRFIYLNFVTGFAITITLILELL